MNSTKTLKPNSRRSIERGNMKVRAGEMNAKIVVRGNIVEIVRRCLRKWN